MRTIFMGTTLILLSLGSRAQAQNQIFPKGQRAPADNMVGTVWLQPLVSDDSAFHYHAASVTFEPTARTYWHYHPGGQALLVIDGVGCYQERGKPIRTIQKGDVIKCLPNVEHWHGASPKSALTHIGITNHSSKGRVVWLKPVTDEEYNSFKEK